eukprot:4580420-Prymnesium_polylepis.1
MAHPPPNMAARAGAGDGQHGGPQGGGADSADGAAGGRAAQPSQTRALLPTPSYGVCPPSCGMCPP